MSYFPHQCIFYQYTLPSFTQRNQKQRAWLKTVGTQGSKTTWQRQGKDIKANKNKDREIHKALRGCHDPLMNQERSLGSYLLRLNWKEVTLEMSSLTRRKLEMKKPVSENKKRKRGPSTQWQKRPTRIITCLFEPNLTKLTLFVKGYSFHTNSEKNVANSKPRCWV